MLLFASQAFAQVLRNTATFSAATPFLEPDGRKEIVRISEREFIVVAKTKGQLNTESEYSIEKFDVELKNLFKVPFLVKTYEDILQVWYNGTDFIIFTVLRNHEAGDSKLIAYGFDSNSGVKKWEKTLMEQKVGNYQAVRHRGAVEESFENAIASSLSKNYVVPFQFQYYISFSPDQSRFIAYIFDYSKPNLVGNATIFDKNLNKLVQGGVPIDNNFINYGVFVNNCSQVYILNVDKLGRIVVIKFNMETKDNFLLDIQYASSQREGLKLAFKNDDEVFIGCVNTANGKMLGVLYAKFNFVSKMVEKLNFHDLGENLKQTANAIRSGNKNVKGPESWMFYELTHFEVNQYEKVLMVLERRELSAPEYNYQSEAVLETDRWKERMAKVITESVVMFSFNSHDELMWENYFLKSQTSDITAGMTSSSFMLVSDDESLRMIYATGDNAAGIFTSYNYVEWNAQNGNKIKQIKLQNDEKLSLVRNYSIWMGNFIILVGRKGLLGKKYMISSFEINP